MRLIIVKPSFLQTNIKVDNLWGCPRSIIFPTQVNYAYLNYEDVNLGFFSQNGGDLTTFSGMIGSRVYLNNIETKKYPIYTNLMVGYGRIEQNEYNSIGVLENKKDNQIAGSLGIFMVFNRKVTLGLAIEGVGAFVNTTLKVGYNF